MNLIEAFKNWNRKRKKTFNDMGFVSDALFPHCDQRVLHAPGECEFCDHYPHYQELRNAWGINFTGEEVRKRDCWTKMLPCPSDYNRGLAGAHVWGGNRPMKEI